MDMYPIARTDAACKQSVSASSSGMPSFLLQLLPPLLFGL